MTDFTTLALPPSLQLGVEAAGYRNMTPIQAQSLPAILAGHDMIAQAPTGSGKTAAFGLGLLHRID
ncbi:MAG TPA: DEAD/DEAH box helicase, partial [Pseudoxanthomonas sp.]|nr:DEAD/DEAH box helicase [Pseudoxanthomonas sp.]